MPTGAAWTFEAQRGESQVLSYTAICRTCSQGCQAHIPALDPQFCASVLLTAAASLVANTIWIAVRTYMSQVTQA